MDLENTAVKNVLILTDFSENSWNATKYALEFFKNENCIFYLLNTYTPVIAYNRFMASAMNNSVGKNSGLSLSKKGLRLLMERINSSFKNTEHSFKSISSFSFLVDEVKELVSKFSIDTIVMGGKGETGVDDVFIGSNTVRIIKAIKNCPILAVPEHVAFKKPEKVGFATDFSRFYTKLELQPLLHVTGSFNAAMHIIHVQQQNKPLSKLQLFNLKTLKEYLTDIPYYVHAVSELDSIATTLKATTIDLDIQLLVMLNYPHSFLEKITREPVVKNMVFHSQSPLLIIPEFKADITFLEKTEERPEEMRA